MSGILMRSRFFRKKELMMVNVSLQAPLWVWGIFACIIFVGVRAMKTRAVSVCRLCIVPAIFLVVGACIFLQETLNKF